MDTRLLIMGGSVSFCEVKDVVIIIVLKKKKPRVTWAFCGWLLLLMSRVYFASMSAASARMSVAQLLLAMNPAIGLHPGLAFHPVA